MYPNSYKPETPGYEGLGQGVGAGIRQVGRRRHRRPPQRRRRQRLRVRLPLPRRRLLVRHWASPAISAATTSGSSARKTFYGGERTEPLFQRFGCGWGCHYALGFCFDDARQQHLRRHDHGQRHGLGLLRRRALQFRRQRPLQGHRRPDPRMRRPGQPRHPLPLRRRRVYEGYSQGYASPGISYHDLPECGGNFSFLINYGGKNTFGCGAERHSYMQRGAAGGFIIDRPGTTRPPRPPPGRWPIAPDDDAVRFLAWKIERRIGTSLRNIRTSSGKLLVCDGVHPCDNPLEDAFV